MKISARTRKAIVFGGLALTLVAVYAVDDEPQRHPTKAGSTLEVSPDVHPRSTKEPTAAASAAPTLALDLSRLKRGGSVPQSTEAFGARDWNPPPRKLTAKEAAAQRAAAEIPPPPPQAPPLPFTYVGMLGSEDETIVFLAQQDTNHAVKRGDVINGTYRVDEIDSGRVVFTYLPLDQRQTLAAKTE
jgi:hypothetical protein